MADTPTVYVICDKNCKFEGMTKEQIFTAIVEAVNEGKITNVDAGFITTLRTINNIPLKVFVGTQAEYETLADEAKENLFALITDDTTGEGFDAAIEYLQDELDELREGLNNGVFVPKKATALEPTYTEPETNIRKTEIAETGIYAIDIRNEDRDDTDGAYVNMTAIIIVTDLSKKAYSTVTTDITGTYTPEVQVIYEPQGTNENGAAHGFLSIYYNSGNDKDYYYYIGKVARIGS